MDSIKNLIIKCSRESIRISVCVDDSYSSCIILMFNRLLNSFETSSPYLVIMNETHSHRHRPGPTHAQLHIRRFQHLFVCLYIFSFELSVRIETLPMPSCTKHTKLSAVVYTKRPINGEWGEHRTLNISIADTNRIPFTQTLQAKASTSF